MRSVTSTKRAWRGCSKPIETRVAFTRLADFAVSVRAGFRGGGGACQDGGDSLAESPTAGSAGASAVCHRSGASGRCVPKRRLAARSRRGWQFNCHPNERIEQVALTPCPSPASGRGEGKNGKRGQSHFRRTKIGTVPAQIEYLLYLPREYDPGRKWPMLVCLHGSGNPVTEVRLHGPTQLIDQGKHFDFIVLSPLLSEGLRQDRESLVALIEHVSNTLAVDRDRVLLTGISSGGAATWCLACYDPDRFAAIAPVCGGGDVTEATRLQNVPVWTFCGERDRRGLIRANNEMVDAVNACGGCAKLTVYPKYEHDVWEPAYSDPKLYEWLLNQRRGLAHFSAAPIKEGDSPIFVERKSGQSPVAAVVKGHSPIFVERKSGQSPVAVEGDSP